MSTQHNQNRLTAEQKQQFHEDGFLFVRNVLPNEALQPLIDELAQRVDDGTCAAVKHGILDPSDTYDDAVFREEVGDGFKCLFRSELDLEQFLPGPEDSDRRDVHTPNCARAP